MPDGTKTLRTEPVQDRGDKTLERLRAAARSIYNDPHVGRDRLTTTMVAKEAGISIGTVYRYWADRVAILEDIAAERDQSPIGRNNPGGQAVCEHGYPVDELCTTVQQLVHERWMDSPYNPNRPEPEHTKTSVTRRQTKEEQ